MHPHTLSRTLVLPVALLVLAAAAAPAQDGPPRFRWRADRELSKSGSGIKDAFRQVVADANKATVKVRSEGKDVALGTVVAADGYVLTKASELSGDAVVVLRDASERPARIVGVAEDHDLALLKIDAAGLTPVRWADASAAAVGQWVVTTGMADSPSALGVVSVGRRRIAPRTGRLGVGLADGADRSGARVTEVFPESPAEKAGIRVDDVIARVNDKPVDGREALVATIRTLMPGQEVRLNVRRGDETV